MPDDQTHPKSEFNRLYTDISASIATATAEIAALHVDHVEGKKEIGGLLESLHQISRRFDDELALLQKHAEWDRFTLAFFGETNAGKSTIIESLRILFQEDSRQKLLDSNHHDLMKYEQELATHIEHIKAALDTAHQAQATELLAIKARVATLTDILQTEVSARIRRKHWLVGLTGFVLGVAIAATALILVPLR